MANEKFNPMFFAKIVQSAWPLVYKPDDNFYQYLKDRGVWEKIHKDYVDSYVVDFLNGEATPYKVGSITTLVQDLDLIPSSRDFNERKHLINVKNGMYDIWEKKLLPHDPDHYSTIQLNVKYDPDAKAPQWLSFLEQVFDGDPDVIALAQEFMGYTLIPDTRFEKALIFVGDGANGKSTLVKVWEELIGHENVSSVTLTNLKEIFHRVTLHGKLINIAAEISSATAEQSDYFKRIVSGYTIDAAHKNRPVFNFKPYARLVFAMNDMPRVKDSSPGFYRRLIVVPFKKRFEGKNADRALGEKLLSELDGIFLWALEGLYRLFENDGFTEPRSVKEMLNQYQLQNNPVRAFVDECCMLDPEAVITKADLYQAYRSYAIDSGYERIASNVFFRDLNRVLPKIATSRIGSKKGARKYAVKGVRLRQR